MSFFLGRLIFEPEGPSIANIKEVAEAAGVSSTTVSHVINRTRSVAPGTAAKVWAAVEKLQFTPSTVARSLRTKSSLTIGVVSDYAGNPFFSEVFAGIEEICFERNFGVFLSFSERDPEKETSAVRNLLNRGVEGLILQPIQADAGLEELLNRVRVPLVLFQRSLPGWHRDALVTDDASGAREVMDHLLGLGHRRIALVTGHTYPSHPSRLREQSYRQSLIDAGIGIDPLLIQDGNYTFELAAQVTRDLLALPEPPTALFCISDRMALGCLSAVQDAGLRVPADISLVGYDNLELLRYVRPLLTTVDHGGRESGRRLALRLLERIKAPDLFPEALISLPRLLVRDSTGPVPGKT